MLWYGALARVGLVDDARAVARLGGQNELVRRGEVRVVKVASVEAAVPVHADAVKPLGRLGVGVQPLGPIEHVVLVMVEADDLHARVLGVQHRPEVVAHKRRHEARCPEHRLPPSRRLGLVLHRHAPEADAVRRVR
jgi:hypothetical protein